MHVLYLSYDGLTDPLGGSQILPYIKGLTSKGYRFTIISFEKEEAYESGKIMIHDQLKGLPIKWVALRYTKTPPILSTIKDVFLLWKTTKELSKTDKFDLIHCRSYISSLIGLKAKKILGVKFLFDMRGFWADERVDGGIWNLKNPVSRIVYQYFKSKEKAFFLGADHIVSLTYQGVDAIHKMFLKEKDQVADMTVIPCCVDIDLFDYQEHLSSDSFKIREQLEIEENQFVLGYVGSIGTWYMLPEMISFFKTLLRSKTDAIFLFVTKEDPKMIVNTFEDQAISLNNLRVIRSNRADMPRYISIFNWSIFFIKPVFSKKASSPTKQGEIMSMGKPIICNDNVGDTTEIIEKSNAGVVVNSFDEKTFESTIHQINNFTLNPEKIRKGALDFYDLNNGVIKYQRIYDNLFLAD